MKICMGCRFVSQPRTTRGSVTARLYTRAFTSHREPDARRCWAQMPLGSPPRRKTSRDSRRQRFAVVLGLHRLMKHRSNPHLSLILLAAAATATCAEVEDKAPAVPTG